jgi:hypothetical protein
MSGGSYNYLCHVWEADEMLAKLNDLLEMSTRLAGLGYAEDAAKETEELICIINQAKVRIVTRMNRLKNVWHAVEWWDSADYSESQVKEALEKYRKGD